MPVHFVKMHSNGNDFVIIISKPSLLKCLKPSLIQQWAHRQTGIGFDQLLVVVTKDLHQNMDCHIFNADGSQVGQCGHGLACVGQFLYQEGYLQQPNFAINTFTGRWQLTVLEENWVKIELGIPTFEPKSIPFQSNTQTLLYPIILEGIERNDLKAFENFCIDQQQLFQKILDTSFVNTFMSIHQKTLQEKGLSFCLYAGVLNLGGNPHCVVPVSDVQAIPNFLGPALIKHPQFPEETNVEFIEWTSSHTIKLRTYERGVGETKSCGSGACAAMIVSRLLNVTTCTRSKLYFSHNDCAVEVEWLNPLAAVNLKTQTHFIFKGEISL